MARTFDQVLAEVSKQSDPQRKLVMNQISEIPGQQVAEESSLAAKKDQAYTDILDGARRRGVGIAFGGIPLGEQAKYAATEYAPAVARMKQGFNDRKTSLEMALADIGSNDRMNAYSIYNTDRQFAEQQRQFNEQQKLAKEQMAAQERAAKAAAATQSADLSKYLSQSNTSAASMNYDKKSGFQFRDAVGRPINAAQYSQMMGIEYRALLSQMAKQGDKNAQIALKYVGNDAKFGGAPQQYAGALGALGATGTFKKGAGGGGGGW